jgi:hypothetical protein
MATSSFARTLIGGLEADIKKALSDVFDYLLNNTLAFGPIEANAAQTKTTNFAGRYVKVVTSGTASQEVAVAHGLGRTPNVMWEVASPRVVNSVLSLNVSFTRAADENRFYVASASTGVTFWVYVE